MKFYFHYNDDVVIVRWNGDKNSPVGDLVKVSFSLILSYIVINNSIK